MSQNFFQKWKKSFFSFLKKIFDSFLTHFYSIFSVFEMSKGVCEPIESMKAYLDKRVGKKLRICMNIDLPKAVAHSMNQFFEKTYETWPKYAFFEGFHGI